VKEGLPAVYSTPEWEAILASIRIDRSQDDRLRELLKGGLDWSLLRQVALNQGVMPLLYARLKALGDDLLPPTEMAQLRDFYLANGKRNLRLAQRLLHVLGILSGQGIEAIPFKGPALAVQAYGNFSLRQSADLDILIHRTDYRRVHELLVSLGYSPQHSLTEKEEQWLLQAGEEMHFSNLDYVVDVHWAFAQRDLAFALEPEQYWRRLASCPLNGREVRVLSPEDTILTQCIEGMTDQWRWLKRITDITYLIDRHRLLDWPALLAQAEEVGVRRILFIGLYLAEELGGVHFQPHVRALLHSDSLARKLATRVQERVCSQAGELGPLHRAVFRLRSRERPRDRMAYIMYQVFVPKLRDRMTIGLPPLLEPLYYLLLPCRLLLGYTGGFFWARLRRLKQYSEGLGLWN